MAALISKSWHIPGLDYRKWKKLMEMYFQKSSSTRPSMSKDSFRQLLSFAQGRRERETLTYAVYKASGISATAARKHYGIENIVQRSHVIDESVMEAQTIRDCIDSLSATEEQAMLLSLGIPPDDPSSEDESCSNTESEECIEPCPLPQLSSKDAVLAMLSESIWNWFEFSEQMEQCNIQNADDGTFADMLVKIYDKVISSDNLNPDTKKLLKQSHDAYVCDRNQLLRDVREADSLNGMIVTDSIDVNPEEYVGVRELAGGRVKSLVIKRRKAIRQHNRYLKAKKIAERNFLKRKSSKRTRGILKDYPDIGEVIEKFVAGRNIGADAWRRTGVLTFDGNARVGKKVTFSRIQEHLESTYQREFFYGTVIELCVPRNQRRKSAKRYRGIARVTCRRARKGFQLRYNPDAHWSAALYRGLNQIQYEDGCNVVNVNRDDASGFRLDTMKHINSIRQQCDPGKASPYYPHRLRESLPLYSPPRIIFPELPPELCAGTAKATGDFPKNPAQHLANIDMFAQHLADIDMLEQTTEIPPAFLNPLTGQRKQIECIRVDGACNEGPSHEEVQFYWTVRHVNKPYFATLVTACSSGCSYLNRVELQNGCLALGHSNLFIPFTLCGTSIDPETGKIHRVNFMSNMEKGTEIYLNRVSGSPCGETNIHFF